MDTHSHAVFIEHLYISQYMLIVTEIHPVVFIETKLSERNNRLFGNKLQQNSSVSGAGIDAQQNTGFSFFIEVFNHQLSIFISDLTGQECLEDKLWITGHVNNATPNIEACRVLANIQKYRVEPGGVDRKSANRSPSVDASGGRCSEKNIHLIIRNVLHGEVPTERIVGTCRQTQAGRRQDLAKRCVIQPFVVDLLH